MIQSELIQILIGGQNYFASTGYIEAMYIERELLKPNEKAGLFANEEELLKFNQRIIIIADDAGVGESMILTSLARKIKKFNNEM